MTTLAQRLHAGHIPAEVNGLEIKASRVYANAVIQGQRGRNGCAVVSFIEDMGYYLVHLVNEAPEVVANRGGDWFAHTEELRLGYWSDLMEFFRGFGLSKGAWAAEPWSDPQFVRFAQRASRNLGSGWASGAIPISFRRLSNAARGLSRAPQPARVQTAAAHGSSWRRTD